MKSRLQPTLHGDFWGHLSPFQPPFLCVLPGVGCRAVSLWQGSSSSFLADLPSPAIKREGALQAAAHFTTQPAASPEHGHPSAPPELMWRLVCLMGAGGEAFNESCSRADMLSILPFCSILGASGWDARCLLSLQLSSRAPRLVFTCTDGPKLTYGLHPFTRKATAPPCFASSRSFLSAQRDAGAGSGILWTFLIAPCSPQGWHFCRHSGARAPALHLHPPGFQQLAVPLLLRCAANCIMIKNWLLLSLWKIYM